MQQERDLDLSLRQTVTEAGEKLAELLQQKEQLQASNSDCEARQEGLKRETATLQAVFNRLEADKVPAHSLSDKSRPVIVFILHFWLLLMTKHNSLNCFHDCRCCDRPLPSRIGCLLPGTIE